SINALEARLQSDGAPPVVALTTRQPFEFVLGPDAPPIANPGGELASIELQGLKAEWFDGLVPDFRIRGRISDARFTLASPGANTLVLAPERALAVADLAVKRGKQVLVKDIDLEIVPNVTYEPGKLQVLYKELHVKGRSRPLLSGFGELNVAGLGEETISTGAAGTLRFFSDGLAALPAAASAVGEEFGAAQLRGAFSYALERAGNRIDIARLDGTIAVDGTPRISLAAATPLVVRTTLTRDENLAGHVTGSMRVGIDGLASDMLAGILPLSGVSFAAVNGAAELNSDGRRLTAQVTEPLALDDVRIGGEDGPLLRPFSIAMAADLLAEGRHYEAALSKLTLNFAGDEQPAVAGRLSFSVEPDHPIPLRRLAANLNGDLPALLEQPVALPGHALKAGGLAITAEVADDGSIRSSTRLGGLSADAALAMTDFVIEATGRMAPDGRGFTLNMPLTGTGRTGDSDALIEASYAPQPGKDSRIDVSITSEKFLLNDLLASIDAVKQPRKRPARGKKKDEAGTAAPAEKVAAAAPLIDDTPDEKAFWNVLPPDMQVGLSIDELRYADNLSFNDIRGRLVLTDTRLGLTDIAARYHDSPLRFDGAVDFSAGVADPYQVALEGAVKEFDLNRFFTELRPGVTPRLEGLFGVDISAYGDAPNAGQFRNRILFDMALTSRDGVYRPLDPDSALVAGASGALGLVGEGLSYLPTSGFG
ncbi:MAG: hypothetical protein KJO38_08000, partial [Gammaproteobacteria bacterium]|nr:hypothetical protein [Gammaproteobacteria bacterium]